MALFEETKAQIAFGVALMPMELLWPELPPNRYYNFSHTPGERDAKLTYKRGYLNGYSHNYQNWRMILTNPVISHRGVQLVVEITQRAGPMCVFKIYRGSTEKKVVLTENEEYVRILDMQKMYDAETDQLVTPLRYISVKAKEFFDTVNYLASLDEKSVSFTNAAAYVRRRMGGMSLATQELLAPWDLPSRQVVTFCLTCVAYVRELSGSLHKFANAENLEVSSWWESVKIRVSEMFKQGIRSMSTGSMSVCCPLQNWKRS